MHFCKIITDFLKLLEHFYLSKISYMSPKFKIITSKFPIHIYIYIFLKFFNAYQLVLQIYYL